MMMMMMMMMMILMMMMMMMMMMILMMMMMMMMMMRFTQVPMLCVPIYNMKLTMMQETPIFTTFSTHTQMTRPHAGDFVDFKTNEKSLVGVMGMALKRTLVWGHMVFNDDTHTHTMFMYQSV